MSSDLPAVRGRRFPGWALGALFGALLCALAPWAAHAQAGDARSRARSLFAAGVQAFEHDEFERARQAFTEAYALSPHPSVRLNLAFCEERLGRAVAAREHFRAYLREATPTPAERAEVEAAITRVSGRIGELAVSVAPRDALLFVDDAPASPGTLPLDAGPHRLRASREGSQAVVRNVLVVAGGQQRESLELPLPAPAEPAPALPLATTADAADARAAPGSRPSGLRTWAISSGLLTAAFAGSALGTGLVARGADSDFGDAVHVTNDATASASQRAVARAEGERAANRAHRLARVTDGLLGGAVGMAVVTTVLVIVYRRHGREAPRYGASLSPRLGGAELALTGSF